jgi:hypothetical protein
MEGFALPRRSKALRSLAPRASLDSVEFLATAPPVGSRSVRPVALSGASVGNLGATIGGENGAPAVRVMEPLETGHYNERIRARGGDGTPSVIACSLNQ